MTTILNETASLGKKSGNKYRVKIIEAGQGSSGFYSEDVLREYGPTAFPPGTFSFVNHITPSEEWERPVRDVEEIAGVLESAPVFENGALYGEIKFTSRGAKLVEELGEHIGLSISASGKAREGEDGSVIVESIHYSPLNSIDIVTRAGAGGKIEHLLESYRGTMDNNDNAPNTGADERIPMTEEDIKKIAEAVKAVFADFAESLRPAPATEVEAEESVDVIAAVEAITEAGLTKTARARVIKAIEAGTPLDEAVQAEKDLRDEVLKEAEAEGLVLHGEKTDLNEQFGALTFGKVKR